jgi:hypothetical protein
MAVLLWHDQEVTNKQTHSPQWHLLATWKRKCYTPCADQPSASVWCICPKIIYTFQAIQAGLQRRPALLVCNVASRVLPAAVDRIVRAGRRDRARGSAGFTRLRRGRVK